MARLVLQYSDVYIGYMYRYKHMIALISTIVVGYFVAYITS